MLNISSETWLNWDLLVWQSKWRRNLRAITFYIYILYNTMRILDSWVLRKFRKAGPIQVGQGLRRWAGRDWVSVILSHCLPVGSNLPWGQHGDTVQSVQANLNLTRKALLVFGLTVENSEDMIICHDKIQRRPSSSGEKTICPGEEGKQKLRDVWTAQCLLWCWAPADSARWAGKMQSSF